MAPCQPVAAPIAQEAACRSGIETAPQGRQARRNGSRCLEQGGECEGILAEHRQRGRGGGRKGRSMTP